jgi:hypothetical protein
MIAPYLQQNRSKTTKFSEKNEFIFEFYDEKYIRIVDLYSQCDG